MGLEIKMDLFVVFFLKMKQIKLTQGKVSIVDDADHKYLSQWKWCFEGRYATRQPSRKLGKRKPIYMHRFILNPSEGMEIDHINRNKLDNRRSNLRICIHSQNLINRGIQKNNTSGYAGVTWYKPLKKWMASIKVDGRFKNLGYFKNKEDAILMRQKLAKLYYKDFFPQEVK